MKWTMSSVAILVAAVSSAALGAQTGGTMAKGDKMKMMDTTYAGCIEAGSTAGTFRLTHVAPADRMGKDMMKKDATAKDTMAKDTMAKDAMAKDAMAKDGMAKDAMAKDGMSKDAMAPTTLTLTGSSVDLSKHLGHKVSITGSLVNDKMDAMAKSTMGKSTSTSTFTVKSLKVVATTCS